MGLGLIGPGVGGDPAATIAAPQAPATGLEAILRRAAAASRALAVSTPDTILYVRRRCNRLRDGTVPEESPMPWRNDGPDLERAPTLDAPPCSSDRTMRDKSHP
jgi:hypothetical protein